MAALCCITMAQAIEYYGITFGTLEVNSDNEDDIFGDGKASYDAGTNTLFLAKGFSYSLSKGFVNFDTEKETVNIHLEGDASISAAVKGDKHFYISADGAYTLSIKSNTSGSALECKSLHIAPNVKLDLLSRNSQSGMYALNCAGKLKMEESTLTAEVTTADMAVKVKELELTKCVIEKPKGGGVNSSRGGICYADGLPAKIVRIVPGQDQAIETIALPDTPVQKVIRDGRLIILRGDRIYTATGQNAE